MLKLLLKRLLLVLGIVLTIPLIILAWLEAWIGGRDYERVFSGCKEILSIVPTIFGEYARLGFYVATCRSVAVDVAFLFGSMVAHRDTVICRGVVIGVGTIIGKAVIGEGVLFGARVSLLSGKYQHGRPDQRRGNEQVEEAYETINIGDHSWIGQEAIIMANVGSRCTVGAGAVLMKDAPDGSTFLGNPARKVNIERPPSGPTNEAKS